MAAHKQPSWRCGPHERDCPTNTHAVPGCPAERGWSMRAQLAEWQIKTQHGEARCGESRGHLRQESGLAVCASTMREHHGVPIGLRRQLQETLNGGVGIKIQERPARG